MPINDIPPPIIPPDQGQPPAVGPEDQGKQKGDLSGRHLEDHTHQKANPLQASGQTTSLQHAEQTTALLVKGDAHPLTPTPAKATGLALVQSPVDGSQAVVQTSQEDVAAAVLNVTAPLVSTTSTENATLPPPTGGVPAPKAGTSAAGAPTPTPTPVPTPAAGGTGSVAEVDSVKLEARKDKKKLPEVKVKNGLLYIGKTSFRVAVFDKHGNDTTAGLTQKELEPYSEEMLQMIKDNPGLLDKIMDKPDNYTFTANGVIDSSDDESKKGTVVYRLKPQSRETLEKTIQSASKSHAEKAKKLAQPSEKIVQLRQKQAGLADRIDEAIKDIEKPDENTDVDARTTDLESLCGELEGVITDLGTAERKEADLKALVSYEAPEINSRIRGLRAKQVKLRAEQSALHEQRKGLSGNETQLLACDAQIAKLDKDFAALSRRIGAEQARIVEEKEWVREGIHPMRIKCMRILQQVGGSGEKPSPAGTKLSETTPSGGITPKAAANRQEKIAGLREKLEEMEGLLEAKSSRLAPKTKTEYEQMVANFNHDLDALEKASLQEPEDETDMNDSLKGLSFLMEAAASEMSDKVGERNPFAPKPPTTTPTPTPSASTTPGGPATGGKPADTLARAKALLASVKSPQAKPAAATGAPAGAIPTPPPPPAPKGTSSAKPATTTSTPISPRDIPTLSTHKHGLEARLVTEQKKKTELSDIEKHEQGYDPTGGKIL